MTGHRDRLNEIAAQHGLRPLSGKMNPSAYISYAMDLALVGMGLLHPAEVRAPMDVFEEYRARTGEDWPGGKRGWWSRLWRAA